MAGKQWRRSLVISLAVFSPALAVENGAGKSDANVFQQVPELRLAAADAEKPVAPPVKEETIVSETTVSDEDYTSRQTILSFTSLADGQPGYPGEIRLIYSNGWWTSDGQSDPWLTRPEIAWTPQCLPNTMVGMKLPIILMNGGYEGNGDIYPYWIQRIIQEKPCCWYPSVSVINELRLPTGYHSEKVDWTLTGVLAKEVGPGTAYLNGFLRSANGENNIDRGDQGWGSGLFNTNNNGDDRRHFQWGYRVGYKWRITECFALIGDYIMQSNNLYGHQNQNIGEVSAEWRVNKRLAVGPGIFFTLDGQRANPNFGAGLRLTYSLDSCF